MTWAATAPGYAPAVPPPGAPAAVVRYAGFWRRYWGLFVDQLLVNLVTGIVGFGLGLLAGVLASATAECETVQVGLMVRRSCTSSPAVGIMFLIIDIVLAITIWYRLIPRRLAALDATPGMCQLGLEVQDARDGTSIGLGAAIARSLLPFLLQLGGIAVVASVLIFSFDADEPAQSYWWWFGLAVGLVVACYGAALWSLVDRRHQTLYDKIVGSVVVETRAVNWWAVASFVCATTMVLAPVAIVAGHIGLHQISDPHNRQSGHGLAAWGTVLGYVITILGGLFVAIVWAAGNS